MSKERQMKKYYIPKPVQKRDAPRNYFYELSMFRHMLIACVNLARQHSQSSEIFKNATLESLLVHVRNLFDFFYGGETDKDDMRAFHFVKGGMLWQAPKAAYLEKMRPKINKHLSHLTYSRVLMTPSWNLMQMAAEIEEANKKFLEALPAVEADRWKAV
jgi:hypothetical protein